MRWLESPVIPGALVVLGAVLTGVALAGVRIIRGFMPGEPPFRHVFTIVMQDLYMPFLNVSLYKVVQRCRRIGMAAFACLATGMIWAFALMIL